MKIRILILCSSFIAAPVFGEDIGQVFERSHRVRLETMPVAAAEASQTVALRESFARLKRELPLFAAQPAVELRVVTAGSTAETLGEGVIVINAALGELPEVCRLFLIAHEMGHVVLEHWAQRVRLYRSYIPGEVVQAETDKVAPMLGRAASMQSREQESAADAFAMNALLDLGYEKDDLIDMFKRLGHHAATATHPSTAQRIVHLRMIDEERRQAKALAGSPA